MNMVAFITNLFDGPDLIIILVLFLLLFGAKRLPELARGLGQAVNEFSKAKDDFRHQVTRADEPAVQPPQGVQAHTLEPAPATPPLTASAPAAPKPEDPKPLA